MKLSVIFSIEILNKASHVSHSTEKQTNKIKQQQQKQTKTKKHTHGNKIPRIRTVSWDYIGFMFGSSTKVLFQVFHY